MSVFGGLKKGDFKTASDGLIELSEERLRSIMRTEPITDVYHVEQTPFARGKFASVRKIRHLVTGVEYAAKFIRKRRRAADSTREIHHEVAVLALCADTPRVVRLHEVYDGRAEVAIVLELAVGGELQRALDEDERLAEAGARRALRHVLEALAHLHARRIAHLDLKPQNVLLQGPDVLLCDFGISRAIQPGAHVREILGTRDYVAPEILSYEPIDISADMWSVGVLAYVLLSGYSPFAGATKQETYLNISQGALTFPEELFEGVSDQALDFIRATLVVDRHGRLTVEQCLEHPWLQSDIAPSILPIAPPTLTAAEEVPEIENGKPLENGADKEKASAEGEAEDARAPLKHPHDRETSPPFPDAPSTPKVSRKSHPDSPTSVLNLCKKFQSDAFQQEKTAREKPETNGVYTNGSSKILEACKAFESPSGKGHCKENKPMNGAACGCEAFDCQHQSACCHVRCPQTLPRDRAILC